MQEIISQGGKAMIVALAVALMAALLSGMMPKKLWAEAVATAEKPPDTGEAFVLQQVHETVPAPKIRISTNPVYRGTPIALRKVITADGVDLSGAAGARYGVTVNAITWLGKAGNAPEDTAATCEGGMLSFPQKGTYCLKVTVSKEGGLRSTAYVYCEVGGAL